MVIYMNKISNKNLIRFNKIQIFFYSTIADLFKRLYKLFHEITIRLNITIINLEQENNKLR